MRSHKTIADMADDDLTPAELAARQRRNAKRRAERQKRIDAGIEPVARHFPEGVDPMTIDLGPLPKRRLRRKLAR